MFMIRGNFYVENTDDMVLTESEGLTRSDIAAAAPKDFTTGLYIVISEASFNSLINSYLDPTSNLFLQSKTTFTVEQLEDLIEGYSNAFDEDEKIDIISSIVEGNDVYFDETFGNVAFKMTQKH